MNGITILQGDALEMLKTLPEESVNCVVTSPPYWGLRDYGCDGQIGLEDTLQLYIAKMVELFGEVWRVLRADGTVWVNLGDSYNSGNKGNSGEMNPSYKQSTNSGSLATRRGEKLGGQRNGGAKDLCKPKDLCGIPWRVAFALQADGWYLRSDIIWSKPNPMPESVTDRPTKAHEYIFLLTKSERYYYNREAILEPVTGGAHARGDGVNPKAKWKTPDGWDTSSGNGGHGNIHREGREDGYTGYEPKLPANYKGSLPGRKDGPGQDRRSKNDRSGDRKKVGFNERWDEKERQAKGVGHRLTLTEGYERAPQCKQNESFSAAVSGLVDARNKRSVWTVSTQAFPEAHFATFPEELIKPCILAGCPAGGTVLDPFFGSGTTGLVARANGCKCIGIELNPEYIKIAERRLAQEHLFIDVSQEETHGDTRLSSPSQLTFTEEAVKHPRSAGAVGNSSENSGVPEMPPLQRD